MGKPLIRKTLAGPTFRPGKPWQVYAHVSVREGERVLETTRADEGGSGVPRAFVLGKGRRVPRAWELALLGDPPSPLRSVLHPAPPLNRGGPCCDFSPSSPCPAPEGRSGVPPTLVAGRGCRVAGILRCSAVVLCLPRVFRPSPQNRLLGCRKAKQTLPALCPRWRVRRSRGAGARAAR